MPFSLDREHRFEFTPAKGRHASLSAAAVHCLRVTQPGNAAYVTGFAFVRTPEAETAIKDLVNAIRMCPESCGIAV